jgi:hypothetical protein
VTQCETVHPATKRPALTHGNTMNITRKKKICRVVTVGASAVQLRAGRYTRGVPVFGTNGVRNKLVIVKRPLRPRHLLHKLHKVRQYDFAVLAGEDCIDYIVCGGDPNWRNLLIVLVVRGVNPTWWVRHHECFSVSFSSVLRKKLRP